MFAKGGVDDDMGFVLEALSVQVEGTISVGRLMAFESDAIGRQEGVSESGI